MLSNLGGVCMCTCMGKYSCVCRCSCVGGQRVILTVFFSFFPHYFLRQSLLLILELKFFQLGWQPGSPTVSGLVLQDHIQCSHRCWDLNSGPGSLCLCTSPFNHYSSCHWLLKWWFYFTLLLSASEGFTGILDSSLSEEECGTTWWF